MAPQLRRCFSALTLLSLAVALGGCVGGGTWYGLAAAVLFAALSGVSGCSSQPLGAPAGDGGPQDATSSGTDAPKLPADPRDGATDTDADPGSWQQCCPNGRLETCYCPPHTDCNYGAGLVRCDDGTCSMRPGFSCSPDAGTDVAMMKDAPPDVPPEAAMDRTPDGFDYPCCLGGRVQACYCPPGVSCNYSPYRTCPDGTCYGLPFGAIDAADMCSVDASSGQ
jgi:hypothetical protein